MSVIVKRFKRIVFVRLKRNMLCLFVLVFIDLHKFSEAACLFRNPGFNGKPKLEELSPVKLKVEWGGDIMNDADCVDHFYVHYWKTNEESRNDNQKIDLNKNTFSTEINVSEGTKYSIQINAFEDGFLQSGNNWSEVAHIVMSKGLKIKLH